MLFSWGLDFQWTRSCSEVRNHSWGRMVGNSPPEVSLPPPGNLMCSAFFFSIPAVLWQTLPLPWKLLAGVGVEAAVALAESFRDWNFPGCGGKHARFKKKKKSQQHIIVKSLCLKEGMRSLITRVEQTNSSTRVRNLGRERLIPVEVCSCGCPC